MRLFVAIDLSEAVHRQLAELIDSLSSGAPNAKWVKAENVHLTLQFLGEIPEERVPALQAALDAVARRHPPVSLHTERGGSFGSKSKPRVLWVGLTGELEALRSLQRDVERATLAFGVEPEDREYSPHLTLARARDPRGDRDLSGCVQRLADLEAVQSTSSQLLLVRSHLSPKGPRYETLHAATLTG